MAMAKAPVRGWSRRGFLRLGGAAAALASVGGVALWLSGRAHYARLLPAGAAPAVLDDKALAILAVACDRFLDGASRPSARQSRVAERIDRELSFHPRKLRGDVQAALVLLEHGGWLDGSTSRFTALAPAAQDARLRQLLEGRSRLGATGRLVVQNLKLMASFFHYCDQRTWPAIGYAGPHLPARAPEADSRVAAPPA
jgi:hypothetical protein